MDTSLRSRTIALLLVFVVLGVYYPAIFAPINSVDDPGMYTYLLNTDCFSFHNIFVPGGMGAYYRPILLVSFLADKFVWGLEESFMHLENILFHLTNVLLLFAVARRASRLMGVDSPLPAFLAAFFFAIHPINTESVIWISGRTDLLACMFILLSAYFFLAPRRTFVTSILSALALLLACLAKDTAIFFLPAAGIFPFFVVKDGGQRKGTLWSTFRENLAHVLVLILAGIGYFVFRELAFSRGDLGAKQVMTHVVGSQGDGVLLGARLVLKAAGFYVKKLFIPFPLNFGINHVSDLYIVVGLFLIALTVRLLVRRTLAGFFFVAAIAIGSSALLVPLLKMTWTPLAERYMYMPSAFFLLGIAFTLYPRMHRMRHQKIATTALAAIAALAIYGTAQRCILWQDNLALYRDTVRNSPDFIPAQNEVANALYVRGRVQDACKVIQSISAPKGLINDQNLLISKAAAAFNQHDYAGAHAILMSALANPGKYELQIIQRMLKMNDDQLMQKTVGREPLFRENVKLLNRLYQMTGDPFYMYRLGQTYLFMRESGKACDALQIVVAKASPHAYYYPAARKLLAKLPR